MSFFRNKSKFAVVIALSLMLSVLVPAFTVPAVAAVDADNLFVFKATQLTADEMSFTVSLNRNSYITSSLISFTFNDELLSYIPESSTGENSVCGIKNGTENTCVLAFMSATRETNALTLAEFRFHINNTAPATAAFTVSAQEIFVSTASDTQGNSTENITSTFAVKNVSCKLNTAVNEIRLKSTLSIYTGQSSVLSAEVLPADAFNKTLTWSVESGAEYASVAQNGTVTALAEGEAVIAVTNSTGTVVARCTVTVSDIPRQIIPLNATGPVSIDREKEVVYIHANRLNSNAVAALFLNENLKVYSASGTLISGTKLVPSGAELRLEIGSEVSDVLTVIIVGDANADGAVTTDDARLALRVSVGLDTIEGFRYYSADVLGTDNRVTTDDARKILRAAVGLDTL